MKNKPYNKTILDYEKNGWVIVKKTFLKKEIEEIKKQILKKVSSTKQNKNFYFEK